LVESEKIASGSVDLILTDLPYGNMDTDGGRRMGINGWDNAINPADVFKVANRILRKNGKAVFFSQEPYTTALVTNAIPNLPFCYRMIWEKNDFANALGARKAPVSFFEDVLVFSKTHPKHDFEGAHPLREYFAQVLEHIGEGLKAVNERLGHRRAEHTFYIDSTQYSLCTEATYRELIEAYSIDAMEGYKPFAELKAIDVEYRGSLLREMNEQYPATFNLWEGKKYKSNILTYRKDYGGLHPTQKPVLLLEDLIKTYSNKGDLVVDLTMGSGSTGVACKNTERRFVGIEMNADYFAIAEQRIREHMPQLTLWDVGR
jgi:site-specific DNA-methyltransferase (adenine-specific)